MTDAELDRFKAEFTVIQSENAAMRALLEESLDVFDPQHSRLDCLATDCSVYRLCAGCSAREDVLDRIRALLGTAEAE